MQHEVLLWWPDLEKTLLTGAEKQDAIEWFRIANIICGVNGERRRKAYALTLAKKCNHPDAQWFVSFVHNHGGANVLMSMTSNMFLQHHNNDQRALYFGYHSEAEHVAEEMGLDPTLYGKLKLVYRDFSNTLQAAMQRNPYGYCEVASLIRKKHKLISRRLFREAADYGVKGALFQYSETFKKHDINRYIYRADAAKKGCHLAIQEFCVNLSYYQDDLKRMFCIGYAFNRDAGKYIETPFFYGQKIGEHHIGLAFKAIAFYNGRIAIAKEAIKCWYIVGRRKRVVKDIRIMIAKVLWANRVSWAGEQHRQHQKKKRAKVHKFAHETFQQ